MDVDHSVKGNVTPRSSPDMEGGDIPGAPDKRQRMTRIRGESRKNGLRKETWTLADKGFGLPN